MQVLALMGFHVSPVGFLSPPRQLQEPVGAIQNPLPLGEQLVITLQFILCLQGVPSRAPTGSQLWKYNLWGHCGFWSALAEGINFDFIIFPI